MWTTSLHSTPRHSDYRFDQSGVYDVYCGPHHVFSMVGRLVVGDVDKDATPGYVDTFEGPEDPPILAPYGRKMLEGELTMFGAQRSA